MEENQGVSDEWMTEWRDVDYDTLLAHKKKMLKWIGGYNGAPRPGFAEGMIALGNLNWTFRTRFDQISDSRPASTVLRSNKAAPDICEAVTEIEHHLAAMNHEEGVWQRKWPDLPPKAIVAMRSGEWGEKLYQWPIHPTLEGHGKRDIRKIGELLVALERSILDAAVINAPRAWVNSNEAERSQFYKELPMMCCEAQAHVLKTRTPLNRAPAFSILRAAGLPGQWNFNWPHEKKNRYQDFSPQYWKRSPITKNSTSS